MNAIKINRFRFEDIELVNDFFEIVIRDTFEKNSISDLVDTIDNEIEDKRIFLNEDMESGGKKRYFLIAKDEKKIVGTIEYGASNQLIIACTNGKFKELIEIGTVFVHPDYQNKGIGSRMLNLIYVRLKENKVKDFCLDSGYKSAQQIWINKFGNPEYHLKNYWGENADHMIWRISLKDV